MYQNLFSPIQIGRLKLKNRVIMPAMGSLLTTSDGGIGTDAIAYYEERAKGGVGLIIVEVTAVDYVSGRNGPTAFRVDDCRFLPEWQRLAERIHIHGAKIFAQLHHPGNQTSRFMNSGNRILSPSGVRCFAEPDEPDALTTDEVKELIQRFISGAEILQIAGLDGVEIHGAHGYLINQFFSPYTNRRTDEYGGSFENRMRFCREVIEGIRATCGPNFCISLRLTVDEFTDYGYHLDEGIRIAKYFEKIGIDLINVTCATYESLQTAIEPASYEQAWRTYQAEAIKKEVNIPVVTVGVIRDPEVAETILKEGKADLIAVGRGHIADPEWCNKARSGREGEIRKCISCLHCFEEIMAGRYVTCAVNPRKGREAYLKNLRQDGQGRKVVVIGGGPGGCEAACVLAKRGFTVVLFEKRGQLGGQLNYAKASVGKKKIGWYIDYLQGELSRLGVDVRLNREADSTVVLAEKPYAVFVATGGEPIIPRLPGIDSEWVCTAEAYLNGDIQVQGKKVAVIGGGLTGCETAILLASNGNDVTVVEMQSEVLCGAFVLNKIDTLAKMERYGVSSLAGNKLLGVTERGVKVEELSTGDIKELDADLVVLALGVAPVRSLYEELQEELERVFVLGDAESSGKIAKATNTAHLIAVDL